MFRLGIDIGSTTVKAILAEDASGKILWRDYRRHETRTAEMLLDFLRRIEAEAGINSSNCRIFLTGSGGGNFASLIGARFVHEVVAATLVVEKKHPRASAMIDLGGQDAKIVVFQHDPGGGPVRKIPSMNDKCAGGTGSVIDKIAAKLGLSTARLVDLQYAGVTLHAVAGKCGVFAETDINSLQKRGVPPEELMASLLDAIVQQNLSVLARGSTLHPEVLLLGGPNAFLPALRSAWRAHIGALWEERKVFLPEGMGIEQAIFAPEHAEYYGAEGAAEFGMAEEPGNDNYVGTAALEAFISQGRLHGRSFPAPGLVGSKAEAEAFAREFAPPAFSPPIFESDAVVRGAVGIDGGSTSTKAVFITESGEVLAKAYRLSRGNPVEDTVEMLENLRRQVEAHGAVMDVLAVGTTGYAKDFLRDVFQADVALVETVAHTRSAIRYFGEPDVIVDVGGQDIKLILLKNGRVKDFRLNTQCSAGNGYFLQATAEAFGCPVERYAETAFSATSMPNFGYGCAVFLQSDIVSFQNQGWSPPEILAGLAAVLPKNVWLYIAKIPNLPELGTKFILQGGTQRNLAAVKAQVDYIRERFRGSGHEPEIHVHPYCGEAGALGAAEEALELWKSGRRTTFIGLEAVRTIECRASQGEDTRCDYCRNRCARTFIEIRTGTGRDPAQETPRILIVAPCEKGAAGDTEALREIQAKVGSVVKSNPNLVDFAAREVWRHRAGRLVADPVSRLGAAIRPGRKPRILESRSRLRVGLPRALHLYTYAPLFRRYLESLGIRPGNIVLSDFSSDELFRAGARRGSIDPCFPSKLALAHVHNLLYVKHREKPLDCIFLPKFDVLQTKLYGIGASNACPTTAATPEVVKAAFTRETDVFSELGISYLDPLVDLSDPALLEMQLFQAWDPLLELSPRENAQAVAEGFESQKQWEAELRTRAREALDQLEREQRIGIVVLGRPYHHDPGINHGICEELQKRGYPVFSQSTLPLDEDLLERLFGDEVRAGDIRHPMEIQDVWKRTFSAGASNKLWAAKFAARHPNLVPLEFSNFKCGHDAPIYSVVEKIIECSGTPYFAFKEIDENRPAGSIKLRVETIDYFLRHRA